VAQLIASLNQRSTPGHGSNQMSSGCGGEHLDGDIEYAAGGHPRAHLQSNRQAGGWLSARGRCSASDEKASYTRRRAAAPRDLVWFTDGLTEARDPNGKVYGPRRLTRFSERTRAPTPSRLPTPILATCHLHRLHTRKTTITAIVLDFSSMGTRL